MNYFRRLSILPLLALLLFGCNKSRDYAAYSKGSAYDILKGRGNYSLFLDAVHRSGYERLVDGGGLITLFAPDNEAMSTYLMAKYGTTKLDEVPSQDLLLLVGYHMIQFSYTPEDFRSFSMTASTDGVSTGDGSCYKFRTYMKRPAYVYQDPLTRRKVNVYSREKYIPVMSSKLFKSRGVSDAEADYKRFFAEVDWDKDDDARLYVGNAKVCEEGIPTDNGYIYTVDKVLEPSPTIFDELNGDFGKEYTVVRRLFDRIACYAFDASVTANYSASGDSLYHFYHWTAPTRAGEIPEIASEWTYHDEAGAVFDRALRYCNNCFFPKDEVLEPYLKEYFKEWGTYEADDFVRVIPKNAIYHFLQSHVFGVRDIILPSELDMAPVIGPNGEHFTVPSVEVQTDFCSNGVIYGMGKVFEPGVFNHITEPLFRRPDYKFYSYAFNTKNLYQQTVDDNNRFTLFLQNDETLGALGYTCSESTQENGSYTLRKGGVLADAKITSMVMSHFVYGDVDFSTADFLRYYVSKDDKTYMYVEDNRLYDSSGSEINVLESTETSNGVVYRIDRIIPERSGGIQVSMKDPDASQFAQLLIKAGILKSDYGYNAADGGALKASMVFIPSNNSIILGKRLGYIPTNTDTLKMYLRNYFVPLEKNKIEHFLLPGVGPEGMTMDKYTINCVSSSPYSVDTDAKYVDITWDPADPKKMVLTDAAGTSICTVPTKGIQLRTNCAAYFLETCFDYHEIFSK